MRKFRNPEEVKAHNKETLTKMEKQSRQPTPITLTHEIASKPDLVNHPPHYKHNGIECIDVIIAAINPETETAYMSVYHANVIKYIFRAFYKGDPLEDCKKARWYLDKLIRELERE